METNQNWQLEEVVEKIETKRTVYNSLLQKNYGVSEEMADNIFTSEVEAFNERMKTYYNDEYATVKRRGGSLPTLNVLQGTNIFLEVMQMGLSFAVGAGLVYVSRLKGTGTAVGYQITGKGEIYLAQKSGAIDYIGDPVIVRNDEKFSIKTNPDGTKYPEHEIDFSKKDFNFEKDYKCGYVFVTFPGGDKDLRWVDFGRMNKARSLSPNKSMYNDISFLQTKIIRRALRNVRKTPFLMSMMSVDDQETQEIDIPESSFSEEKDVTVTEKKKERKPIEEVKSDLMQGLNLNFDM